MIVEFLTEFVGIPIDSLSDAKAVFLVYGFSTFLACFSIVMFVWLLLNLFGGGRRK